MGKGIKTRVKLFRILGATIASFAVAVTGVITVAAPAEAAASCPNNRFCVYTEENFAGNQWTVPTSPDIYNFYDVYKGWNNQISSISNRESYNWMIYDGPTAVGPADMVSARTDLSYLSMVGWNNRISIIARIV